MQDEKKELEKILEQKDKKLLKRHTKEKITNVKKYRMLINEIIEKNWKAGFKYIVKKFLYNKIVIESKKEYVDISYDVCLENYKDDNNKIYSVILRDKLFEYGCSLCERGYKKQKKKFINDIKIDKKKYKKSLEKRLTILINNENEYRVPDVETGYQGLDNITDKKYIIIRDMIQIIIPTLNMKFRDKFKEILKNEHINEKIYEYLYKIKIKDIPAYFIKLLAKLEELMETIMVEKIRDIPDELDCVISYFTGKNGDREKIEKIWNLKGKSYTWCRFFLLYGIYSGNNYELFRKYHNTKIILRNWNENRILVNCSNKKIIKEILKTQNDHEKDPEKKGWVSLFTMNTKNKRGLLRILKYKLKYNPDKELYKETFHAYHTPFCSWNPTTMRYLIKKKWFTLENQILTKQELLKLYSEKISLKRIKTPKVIIKEIEDTYININGYVAKNLGNIIIGYL